MPRTKRSKLVSLTKTARKTKEDKASLIDSLRAASDEYAYVWLFSIGNMRNQYLKEVRNLWVGSRIFFGKNRVMAKALGETTEHELKKGLAGISQRLSGSVGLLFTDSPPAEVADWFDTHERKDYARTGNLATQTVILPGGEAILARSDPPETLPGALEPQLRKLGMPTELKMGVPTLRQEFVVCKEGKRIDTNAAQILKHLLIQQASFRIVPLAYYDVAKEGVTELDLTPEQELLVQQANGKDDEGTPGERKSARVKKPNAARKEGQAAAAAKTSASAMDQDDGGDDEDEEEDDDESMDSTGGDKVTEAMMLPAHLR